LHIDEIDCDWDSKEVWAEAALAAYKTAISVRQRLLRSVTLIIAFSLLESAHAMTPTSWEQLEMRIDWSPPSLYLFERESEPWLSLSEEDSTSLRVKKVDPAIFKLPRAFGTAYFLEFILIDTAEDHSSLFFAVQDHKNGSSSTCRGQDIR
jgi:hypothetical protein